MIIRDTLASAVLIGPLLVFFCLPAAGASSARISGTTTIVWINSYHPGFEWSDGIERGLRGVLEPLGIMLRVFHMDTKKNQEETFKIRAGEEALAFISKVEPHLVVASDDNAQKYLVVPFLKDTGLPVVFCGVNWDASAYGYPADNVTGILEIEPVDTLTTHLKAYAAGDRIGYLSENTLTVERVTSFYNQRFYQGRLKVYPVVDFQEFTTAFLRAQQENDMLIIGNYAGIKNWQADKAEAFLRANLRVPTGSFDSYMARYVLFTVGKIAEEQGELAGRMALAILDGARPSDLPVRTNEQANLWVNLSMAEALGAVIPVSTLRAAEVIPTHGEQ